MLLLLLFGVWGGGCLFVFACLFGSFLGGGRFLGFFSFSQKQLL